MGSVLDERIPSLGSSPVNQNAQYINKTISKRTQPQNIISTLHETYVREQGVWNKKNYKGKAKGKVVHSAHHEGLYREPMAWLHAFLNLEPVVIFFTWPLYHHKNNHRYSA